MQPSADYTSDIVTGNTSTCRGPDRVCIMTAPRTDQIGRPMPEHYVCPNWPEKGAEITITGCGQQFDAVADDEGIVDCPHCGMWFNPAHPGNQAPA